MNSNSRIALALIALAVPGVAQDETGADRIAELIERLEHPNTCEAAANNLVRIGAPALPQLWDGYLELRRKQDPGALGPVVLVEVLQRMGADADPLLKQLLEIIDNRMPQTRRAVDLLAELVPWRPAFAAPLRVMLRPPGTGGSWSRLESRLTLDATADLESLLEALGDLDLVRREVAAQILGRRGERSEPAIDALVTAMSAVGPGLHGVYRTTNHYRVHDATSRAVVALAPTDPRTVPAWIHLLWRGRATGLRCEAARALGGFGSAAQRAVPRLLHAARDGDEAVALEAITALGMLGPVAAEAVPELEDWVVTMTGYPQFVARLEWTLSRITDTPKAGQIARWVAALRKESEREDASAQLVEVGAAAVPPLLRAIATSLANDDVETAAASVHCLGRMGSEARAAIVVLEELQSGEQRLAEPVRAALQKIRGTG